MLPVHTGVRKRARFYWASNIASRAGTEKDRLRTSLPCFSQYLKQNKQRADVLHSQEEAGPYCYWHLAITAHVSSQEKTGFCNLAHRGQGKGDFTLKKTLILKAGLDLTDSLETQDPYLVNSSFCLTGFRLLV